MWPTTDFACNTIKKWIKTYRSFWMRRITILNWPNTINFMLIKIEGAGASRGYWNFIIVIFCLISIWYAIFYLIKQLHFWFFYKIMGKWHRSLSSQWNRPIFFSQTVAAGSLNFIYEIWKTDPTGVRNEWKWPSSHESMQSWLQQPFKQQHSLFTLDNNCQLLKVSQIENSKCRIAAALGGEMKSAETLY